MAIKTRKVIVGGCCALLIFPFLVAILCLLYAPTEKESKQIAEQAARREKMQVARSRMAARDAETQKQADRQIARHGAAMAAAQDAMAAAQNAEPQAQLFQHCGELITRDVYPKIEWFVVRGDDVFLGFSDWPADGPAVLLALAREASKVVGHVEGRDYGNAKVWAVKASSDRNKLPPDRSYYWTIAGNCYFWAVAGSWETTLSDGKRIPHLD